MTRHPAQKSPASDSIPGDQRQTETDQRGADQAERHDQTPSHQHPVVVPITPQVHRSVVPSSPVATEVGDDQGAVLARLGGDEFVVCLEDFGEAANAGAAAQKLLLVLSEKYEIGSSEVYATPSIGIAIYPDSGEAADRLIKAADLAMYEAKKRGGGRFQYYSESLNAKLEQREELEVGLRHALVRDEFVLHYQPRIDISSGRLIGLEALLRWRHPRFGLLPPTRFLAILESSGLIHSAGEWAIATACRQLAAWQRQFELPDLSMAINLSPQQLMHKRLVDAVAQSLDNTAVDPGCIELEIGDGDVVRKRSAELETLRSLRRLGKASA